MNREKKLASFLAELGLTPEEAVAEWVRSGVVDLKKIQQIFTSDDCFVKSPHEIEVGMFLCNDGRISKKFAAGRNCAMVIAVGEDGDTLSVMCTEKASMSFCTQEEKIYTDSISRGLSATHFLKEMAEVSGMSVIAAEYCLSYTNKFVKPQQAFLLSIGEINKFGSDMAKIALAAQTADMTDEFWLVTSAHTDDEDIPRFMTGTFVADGQNVGVDIASASCEEQLAVYPVYEISSSLLRF